MCSFSSNYITNKSICQYLLLKSINVNHIGRRVIEQTQTAYHLDQSIYHIFFQINEQKFITDLQSTTIQMLLIFMSKANKFYIVLYRHFTDCFYAPRENMFEKLVSLYFSKKYKVCSLSGPGIAKLFCQTMQFDLKYLLEVTHGILSRY